MAMEENKEADPESLSTIVSTLCYNSDESQYIINKLITMTINQATLAATKQASIGELENRMKQVSLILCELLFCYVNINNL